MVRFLQTSVHQILQPRWCVGFPSQFHPQCPEEETRIFPWTSAHQTQRSEQAPRNLQINIFHVSASRLSLCGIFFNRRRRGSKLRHKTCKALEVHRVGDPCAHAVLWCWGCFVPTTTTITSGTSASTIDDDASTTEDESKRATGTRNGLPRSPTSCWERASQPPADITL